VRNIEVEHLEKIKDKEYKKFHHYIDASKKYNFFLKKVRACVKI
jgi:hypothetical protein